MEFALSPKDFTKALQRLLPHPSKRRIIRSEPCVMLTADSGSLSLLGEFDNLWSIPANVTTAGCCAVHVQTLLDRLKTYDQKAPLSFVLEIDGLKFGTTKLKLHEKW